MSFTLVRHKNGVEIPIKVSIFDAFRSARPRNPKTTQVTMPANGSSAKVTKVTSTPTTKPSLNDDNKDKTQGFSTNGPETYSEEEDAKLMEMKADGESWNKILEALGKKSKSQLQQRYKEIGPHSTENKSKDDEKNARAEKMKAEGLAKQASLRQAREMDRAASIGGAVKKAKIRGRGKEQQDTFGEGMTTNGNDGNLNTNNTNNDKSASTMEDRLIRDDMRAYVAKYERNIWLAAASRHYDATGQRISPEMAKAMAQGK